MKITNIRKLSLLYGDLPIDFEDQAQEAGLCYHDETSESGPRFFIDFQWILEAENKSHPLVLNILDIAAKNPNHWGITLESL